MLMLAPYAVFALIAEQIADLGLDILRLAGVYVGHDVRGWR